MRPTANLRANAEGMNEHLKEISTQVTPGAHAALICDGAGWHQTGGKLQVPDNITLVPLPAYAPELNPMENVWEYYCAPTNSAISSGTHTKLLSRPANALGTS